MNRDPVVEEKLDELAERTLSGQSTSAADLCRDTPQLLAELERCLRAIHAVDRLRLPAEDEVQSSDGPTYSFAVPIGEARILGRYRLEALLGAGGMGEVWRAFDTQLERPVALKLLHANLSSAPAAKARFLREARAAARIEHDNVVRIFDYGEIDGILVLAMPLLKGETLDARVRRSGALPPQEVSRIGVELLSGLEAAHRAGLIHRDVKPSNVWLEAPNGRAVLLDFGLARPQTGDGLTQAGGVFGTPGFMSPEQARGEPLDGRTDLFSAGAVLYLAATGKSPFAMPGLNTLAMLERTKTHEPPAPVSVRPDLPVELSDFIQQLLHKDPNGRPASADMAAQTLSRLIGLPPAAPSRPLFAAETPTGQFTGEDTERMTANVTVSQWKRERLRIIIGVAVSLLALAFAVGIVARSIFRSGNRGDSEFKTATSTDAEWKGELDVKVGRNPEKNGGTFALNHPGILPLQPGKDYIWIHAKMNRPAYLYIVWIDTEGQASLLHPWDETNKRRPPDEQPVEEFHWPSKTEGAKLGGGPAGTESLLLLARADKLPDEIDVPQLFAGLPKQKSMFHQEAAWFENGHLVTHDRERSSIGFDLERGRPDAKSTVEITDPIIRLQVLLRSDEMRRLFPYTRGVCFSNAGDR